MYPSRCSRLVTGAKLEASAQAPCTSTMVGLLTGGEPPAADAAWVVTISAASTAITAMLRPRRRWGLAVVGGGSALAG